MISASLSQSNSDLSVPIDSITSTLSLPLTPSASVDTLTSLPNLWLFSTSTNTLTSLVEFLIIFQANIMPAAIPTACRWCHAQWPNKTQAFKHILSGYAMKPQRKGRAICQYYKKRHQSGHKLTSHLRKGCLKKPIWKDDSKLRRSLSLHLRHLSQSVSDRSIRLPSQPLYLYDPGQSLMRVIGSILNRQRTPVH